MEYMETPVSQWQPPSKIWNSMFLSIFFANMALNLSQSMSNSLLAKYADSMGAPASQIGMLMSMFAITALVFRFIAGPAMNSFNRKLLLISAMSVFSVANIGFGLSESINGLMFFRLLQGIGNAFANAVCLAIVSEVLPKDKFNSGIGYYSCAQVVTQAIGPSIGLMFVEWVGYSITYIISAGTLIFAILIALRIKLPPRIPKKFTLNLHNMIAKEALFPASIVFFINIGFTTINSFLIVFAAKRGVTDGIGLFFTIYAAAMLLTRPLIGMLTDKFGFTKIGIPAILCTIVSFIIIGQSHSLAMFFIAAIVNACGFGAVQPALQSLCMKSVPSERRGSASSTNFIGMDAATIIGPNIAGFVAEQTNYSAAMWNTMTIPMLISIVIIVLFRKNINAVEEGFKN